MGKERNRRTREREREKEDREKETEILISDSKQSEESYFNHIRIRARVTIYGMRMYSHLSIYHLFSTLQLRTTTLYVYNSIFFYLYLYYISLYYSHRFQRALEETFVFFFPFIFSFFRSVIVVD